MNKIFALAALALSAVAVPAMAQTTSDFTGPRVEARLGFDSAKLNASAGSASGLTYGGGIGYDIAITPKIRLGVEADIDSSTADTKFSGLLAADAKRDIEAGVRVGYVVSPALMVYGKAAYTNQQIGYSLDTTTGKIGLGHETGDGYRVGGGVELAATKHLYAKVEYRYSDYGSDVRSNDVVTGVGIRF